MPGQITLAQLLHIQMIQQEYFEGERPLDRLKQRELALAYLGYAEGQFDSYRRAVSYKHFLPYRELPRSSRVMELIDGFKYLLAAMWAEHVTAEELQDMFLERTDTIYARHQDNEAIRFQQIAGFDIDGVIADLAGAGYDDLTNNEQEQFFEDGGARNLAPRPGAVAALDAFKRAGWSVVLVSARKLGLHSRLEQDTHIWLRKHSIPYDTILWGYDKAEVIARSRLKFAFFVEDNPKHAIDLAKQGHTVYLLNSYECRVEHENIKPVNKITEIAWLYGAMSAEGAGGING